MATNSNQAGGTVVQQPRVLIQATGHAGAPQLRAIAPNLGGLPPGATIQFPVGTIIKDGVVYVPQVSGSAILVFSPKSCVSSVNPA